MLTKTIVMLNMYKTNFQREAGQGLVEYALITVLVSIAVVTALSMVEDEITAVFGEIQTQLSNTGE